MRRYIQVNDVHISDQPPAMRQPSYLEDVLAKLSAVMEAAYHLEVDGVVVTGDTFHRKQAHHTSHRTVQRVREILNGPGLPVWLVPGNHDEAHGGGLTGQPLLSLLGDHVALLDGETPEDRYICGVPWSNDYEREEGAQALADAISVCLAPLVFAHAPLTPTPWPFGPQAGGWIEIAALAPLLPPWVRVVAHGHMHNGHPIDRWVGPGSGWAPDMVAALAEPSLVFSNPGALARATIGTGDVDRVPMVALITYDETRQGAGGTVEYREVPHRPAAEVFRLAEHSAAEARTSGASALAASLGAAGTHIVTPEAVAGLLGGLPRPEGVSAEDWAQGTRLSTEAIEEVSR